MKNRIRVPVAIVFIVALIPSAQAGERVTLSNGFAMDCHHHVQIDGRIRLYVSADETSYIELRPENVTSVQQVPDPPAEQKPIASLPSYGSSKLSPAELSEVLSQAGQAHNLDVDLLASVVKAESNGRPHAVSRAGARGLMQLMPATATDLGVTNSFQPEANVSGGSKYLDELLRRYHENLAKALAAYNAGPAAVDRYGGIPPYRETREYVARVIHEFNRRVRERQAQANAMRLKPQEKNTQ